MRPARAEDETLRRFDPAVATKPTPIRQLETGPKTWRVHRDLATDVSELEVTKDLGRWRVEDVDLEVRDAVWETYRTRGDDFGSPEGETRTERELARGHWRVRIETRTILDASPTHFRLRAELDPWESDTRVHSQNWDETIPRDHV